MARTKTEPVPSYLDLPDTNTVTLPPIAVDNLPPIEDVAVIAEAETTIATVEAHTTPEPSLLDKLKTAAETKRLVAEAAWNAIIPQVAAGIADQNEVNFVMLAAGRSLDDLQAAVERQHEIERLRGVISEHAQRVATHTAARQEFKSFETRKRQIVNELDAEGRKLSSAMRAASRDAERCQEANAALSRLTGQYVPLPVIEKDPPQEKVSMHVTDDMAVSSTEESAVSLPVFGAMLPSD